MLNSSLDSVFLSLWVLASSLCSPLAAATQRISTPIKIPFIPVYWILLGIVQWGLLQPYVSWAYQWGLVTAIGGISLWISLLLIAYGFKDQKEFFLNVLQAGPFKWIEAMLVFTLLNTAFSKLSSSIKANLRIKVAMVMFFGTGFLVHGLLIGCLQWLVLRLYLPQAVLWIPVSGIASVAGMIVLGIFYLSLSQSYDGEMGIATIALIFLASVVEIPLVISVAVGSFVKGVVLVFLLTQLSTGA